MAVWILLAVGAWFVAMGMVGVCAGLVKETDRAQSEVFVGARRAPFQTPRGPRISTPSRSARAHVARRRAGGSRTYAR